MKQYVREADVVGKENEVRRSVVRIRQIKTGQVGGNALRQIGRDVGECAQQQNQERERASDVYAYARRPYRHVSFHKAKERERLL